LVKQKEEGIFEGEISVKLNKMLKRREDGKRKAKAKGKGVNKGEEKKERKGSINLR
jgi:hypothetical protein